MLFYCFHLTYAIRFINASKRFKTKNIQINPVIIPATINLRLYFSSFSLAKTKNTREVITIAIIFTTIILFIIKIGGEAGFAPVIRKTLTH